MGCSAEGKCRAESGGVVVEVADMVVVIAMMVVVVALEKD